MLGSIQVIRNVTRGIPEFDHMNKMNKTELYDLLQLLNVKYYKRGEILYSKFEQSKEAYMLIDGSVSFRDGNNDIVYEMYGKGRSFGMVGLLERQSRSMTVSCENNEGCICLVIDSKTYHTRWKNRMDRNFAQIVATIQKKTLGKIDMKELTMVATCAIPLVLPRGAMLQYPENINVNAAAGSAGDEGDEGEEGYLHHSQDSVLLVIEGECELKTIHKCGLNKVNDTTLGSNNQNHAKKSATNGFKRPSSSSRTRRPVSARTRSILQRATSTTSTTFTTFTTSTTDHTDHSTSSAASLIGPGMIVGDIFSPSGKSAASYTLKCTRRTVLIRLRTHHLHHFLKSDTLQKMKLSTASHINFLKSQNSIMQRQHNHHQQQMDHPHHKPNIPGRSTKERQQHELKLRLGRFTKEANDAHAAIVLMSGRSTSPTVGTAESENRKKDRQEDEKDFEKDFENPATAATEVSVCRKSTRARPAHNIFANKNAATVAVIVMNKVKGLLSKNNNSNEGGGGSSCSTGSSGSSGSSGTILTSPLRSTGKVKYQSIKERWSNMKLSLENAESFHKGIQKSQARDTNLLKNVENEVRGVLSRPPTIFSGVCALPSEMTAMRTRTMQDNSGGGRLLSIGQHRNTFLSNIFAQLGTSGGLLSKTGERADSSGRSSGSRSGSRTGTGRSSSHGSIHGSSLLSKGGGKRKKKKRKKKTRQSHVLVQHAIDRRGEKRSERILTQPKQMFDSLNYNKFV